MQPPAEAYYIGLMSGTSMDAIDSALVKVSADKKTQLIAQHDYPLPDSLRKKISNACNASADSLHDISSLDQQLATIYAQCVNTLLDQSGLKNNQIKAIGSHGQTIRHCPDSKPPYTVQIGNGSWIAELTGITTINNFRQRDMAAGGQGAPLAPIFHQHLFAETAQTNVAINLGGVANISILHADGNVSGFDTGPANNLMDQWIERQSGKRYDKNAEWAKTGQVNSELMEEMLAEPWLSLQPPKSTGPELFNQTWLDRHLIDLTLSTADVQRSLCEFTAITLTNAITQYAVGCEKIIVCGGGAYNPLLVERIEHHLPNQKLISSADYGIAPEWIEAAMFGWLAYRTLNNLSGNIPAVTGANHEVMLGAIHPA